MTQFDELLIRFEFSPSVCNSDTTRDLQKIRRLIECKINFLSQNNILCINENLCPFVTSTESVTACVPICSKKYTFKLP